MPKLMDIAMVLRSKNAGAFVLTIDIIFKTRDNYESIIHGNTLTSEKIAAAYRVSPKDISIIPYPQVLSVKVTMPRRVGSSGDLSDSDVYGAQQHVPLMLLDVCSNSSSQSALAT